MANLRHWLEDAAGNEAILGVVIGEHPYDNTWDPGDGIPGYAQQRRGVLLSWDEARAALDYTFAASFDLAWCNPVYAWTATRVFLVLRNDMGVWLSSVPRHPSAGMPLYNGHHE
jgi:hypothetical protein